MEEHRGKIEIVYMYRGNVVVQQWRGMAFVIRL
jgi:hypothetical protein